MRVKVTSRYGYFIAGHLGIRIASKYMPTAHCDDLPGKKAGLGRDSQYENIAGCLVLKTCGQ